MKKNFNIIEIRGFRGIIMAALIVCCLFAGFIVFPGLCGMKLWNYISEYFIMMPKIGIVQGTLLWGICVVSYFAFRKNKLVVCMKAPQNISDEEIKSMFADIKKQAESDPIIKAMMKARELEMENKKTETESNDKNENVIQQEQQEQMR